MIIVTMILEGSRLLVPTIIFNGNYVFYFLALFFILILLFLGVFGGTLMRRWSTYRDAQVLFTENH